MSPYTCPVCGKLLKSSSSQVIHMHEKSKFHLDAKLQRSDNDENHKTKSKVETVQKTVKAPIPPPPEYIPPVIPIQTTKPTENVEPKLDAKNTKTKTKTEKQEDEWDGEFF